MGSRVLLIFAKVPVLGGVKTRLKEGTGLDDEEILYLYRAFLKDLLILSLRTGADRVYLSCYPKETMHVMEGLAKDCFDGHVPDNIRLIPQEGDDFDDRFTNTLATVLQERAPVVVIGSDSPHIQPATINRAFTYLERGDVMVLGPSGEGGVYLVGMSKPLNFQGVFTEGVELENLSGLAANEGIPLYLLEELSDLDVSTDLITFLCTIQAMEYAAGFDDLNLPVHTIQAIRRLGLVVKAGRGGERGRRIVRLGHLRSREIT